MIGEFSRLYGYQQLALTRELLSCASSSSGAGGGRPAHRLQGGQRKQWFSRRARGRTAAGQRQAVRQAGALPAAHPAPLDGSDPERLTGALTFDRTCSLTGTPPGKRWWAGPSATPRRALRAGAGRAVAAARAGYPAPARAPDAGGAHPHPRGGDGPWLSAWTT
jgi:MoxR-like ATPase